MNHLTASQIATDYGFTARHWIRMAAAGKVPGAYQPGGQGGKWLFDAQAFARWFKNTNRRVESWPGYTKEAKSIGRVPSVKVSNTEAPLRQQIDGWLKDALKNGKTDLKPSRGANVLELPSRRP